MSRFFAGLKAVFIFPALLRVLLCILAGLQSLPLNAEIYQWKDERGRIHYGDDPPDGVNVERIKPESGQQGVSLVEPEAVQDWKQQAIQAPSGTRSLNGGQRFGVRQTNLTAPQPDYCVDEPGSCFSDAQDYVCKLRFGLDCYTAYYWKVCLRQSCHDKRIADQCESPFQLVRRRPAVMTEKDLGRPFPLRDQVSDKDWACLQQHGFFCDEVSFEQRCQSRYQQSCQSLKSWVSDARQRCLRQRGVDCDDVDSLLPYRPVSLEESKKAGTTNASGVRITQDWLMQSAGAERDDIDQYPELMALLNSLPGLNLDNPRLRYDCDDAMGNAFDF